MVYSILEWLASLFNPADTEAFIGTQGYIWDTQSDMFLCLGRDDLQTCGTLEMTLYGIDRNVTRDGIVTVTSVALSFFAKGIPAYCCEYRPNFRAELTEQHGATVRVQLKGPVTVQQIP